MISVAFLTLGCPKNEVDTDKMRARILSSSYCVTDDLEHADVVIINTCSFIVSATEESIETILDVAQEWLGDTRDRHILVAGCLVSRYGAGLADEFPEISDFVPILSEETICERIEAVTGVPAGTVEGAVPRTVQAPFAYVMVADGCHRSCAYCTIPSIRGDYVSKPLTDIVAEARFLSENGVAEIVLIGQDITAYGRDLGSSDTIIDVIDAVCAVESVQRVRLMYLQPDGVTDELIETMARQPKVCHYIEMPLQHCDRQVLRSMNRSGGRETFEGLIARIRHSMPDVTLRTTLIAGYPGETDEQFEELERFLTSIEFDYVGVFPYSPEEGTEAATLSGQIDEQTRIERAQRIRDLADSIGWGKAADWIGKSVTVLVEGIEQEDDVVYGRLCSQAPDIDGIVRISPYEGELVVGEMVPVMITDSVLYDLEGVVFDG